MSIARYIPGTRAWRERRDERLCMETAERIQQIVDGQLPPSAATRTLMRHLEACARCSREEEVFRELKAAIARVGGTGDDQIVERLHDLAQRLCDEESTGLLGPDG